MYYYLIDPEQYDGKNFEFYQTRLLSLLGEYHISGETARVTKLRRVEDLVATAIAHGAKTLVVAGSDKTFSEVVGLCRGKQITIAYIPLSAKSEIGKIIGVMDLEQAVATIARRRVEFMDLARIDDSYFVSTLAFGPLVGATQTRENQKEKKFSLKNLMSVKAQEIELLFNSSYKAKSKLYAVLVINSRDSSFCGDNFKKTNLGDPRDGFLDVVMLSKLPKISLWRYRKAVSGRCYESLPGSSVMRTKKVEVSSPEGLPIFVSGKLYKRSPATIEISGEKVRLVVGKNRQF